MGQLLASAYTYGLGGGSLTLFLIFVLCLYILFALGMYGSFKKAGQPGWAAFIPIYNYIIMLKIAGRPLWWGWFLLLSVIPFGSLAVFIIWIFVLNDISKSFGHGGRSQWGWCSSDRSSGTSCGWDRASTEGRQPWRVPEAITVSTLPTVVTRLPVTRLPVTRHLHHPVTRLPVTPRLLRLQLPVTRRRTRPLLPVTPLRTHLRLHRHPRTNPHRRRKKNRRCRPSRSLLSRRPEHLVAKVAVLDRSWRLYRDVSMAGELSELSRALTLLKC